MRFLQKGQPYKEHSSFDIILLIYFLASLTILPYSIFLLNTLATGAYRQTARVKNQVN